MGQRKIVGGVRRGSLNWYNIFVNMLDQAKNGTESFTSPAVTVWPTMMP